MNYKAFLLSTFLVFMLCVSCRQADENPINKLELIISEKFFHHTSTKDTKMNCSQTDSILARLYNSNRGIRKVGRIATTSNGNIYILESLVEQCGWPKFDTPINELETPEEWNIRSALFLVLQYADKDKMAKYYFNIKSDVEHNFLEKSKLALYQDRLLLNYDLPQVYGTQIVSSRLGKLWDPENVNKRRAAMDLPPIEDYLSAFELNFEEEIAKHKSE